MTPKVILGTVHPDMIDAQFCACLVQTLSEDYRGYLVPRGRVIMSRAPAGMLHVARNAVVQQFLAHPMLPDYLVFIDTDMAWTPEQVWQLVESAQEHNLPVLNAYACMQGGERTDETIPVLYDYEFRPVQPTQEIQQVFCAGSAFMAIRRDVLEQCGAVHGWPAPWFDYGIRNGKVVTEEVIFAQRLYDLTIPIHVDTRIIVGHRKIHTFRPPVPVWQYA